MVKYYILGVFLLIAGLGLSRNDEVYDDIEISLLTCRSGDELYSTFGHTAIRVYNPTTLSDRVYNYGLFDFNTPHFYVKFMRGQLPYLLGVESFGQFLRQYKYEKRSVLEQKLNLTATQKKKLISFLRKNALPENRAYKYDFFLDNCSTRVVDAIEALGRIEYSLPLQQKTFRDLLKENLKNLPWSNFGIDLVIGSRADRITSRRHQMFLPEYVMKNFDRAKFVFEDYVMPVVKGKPYLVLDYEDLNVKRKSANIYWPLIIMALLFFWTAFINFKGLKFSKIWNVLLLSIAGAMGLFVLFMWFGTEHNATKDNWNILWLNPLFLLMIFIKKDPRSKFLFWLLITGLVLAAANVFLGFIPQYYNPAFLPLMAAFTIALVYVFKSNDKHPI